MDATESKGPMLLRNTMAFDRQHAAEFKKAIINAVEFANKHAPQLMVQTLSTMRTDSATAFNRTRTPTRSFVTGKCLTRTLLRS